MSRPLILSDEFSNLALSLSFMGMVDKFEIEKQFPMSIRTIERRLVKLGLQHTQPHLIQITKRYLSGERVRTLAKEFQLSQVTINAFFRRHGIQQRYRTFSFNDNYFDEIDSEDKAYFLGFIIADGCIYKNRLKISIKSIDIDVLEKFKRFIDGNFSINLQTQISTYGMLQTSTIEISSGSIVEALARLGVSERKTETATLPNIRPDLIRHMIRGYMDGDGSFTKYLNRGVHIKYGMNFCGSPETLEFLRNHLRTIHGSEGSLSKRRKDSESRVLQLCYSGGLTVKKYLHYLYNDANVFLDRKMQKFKDML